MSETLVFPDIASSIKPWLTQRLAARKMSVRVETARPVPMVARLVVVSSAGGVRLDLTRQQVRLLVECWDASTAGSLAAMCSAEIEAASRSRDPIAPGVWITASPEDFSVPVSFPDPANNSPRYQFYCNLTLTGSAI